MDDQKIEEDSDKLERLAFAMPAWQAQEVYLRLSEFLRDRPATMRSLGDALYKALIERFD